MGIPKTEAAAFKEQSCSDLQSAVDPLMRGALERIRFQPAPDIGDHAMTALEKADAERGIHVDIALLAIQRGHRRTVLMIRDANRDAPLPALDTLRGGSLGHSLATRLQKQKGASRAV